ncbi:hypothetical protein [Thermococcus peptonophilus]|uniref:hypothetical protein n=1 Tax=Thermococcus peptonophilus TaxID=53952 RepID=UPI00346545E7
MFPLILPPGSGKTLVFKLVPASPPGNYSFTALVGTPYGGGYSPVKFSIEVVPSGEAVITRTECANETVSATVIPTGNHTAVTITSVTTVTEYKTKTVTSTVEVPYTPFTTKLLWFGGVGVAIGAGAIIAVAWYMARSS